jgi:hypothetical protein
MEQFPDQSSINRFFHQLGSQQLQQLELISEQLLQRFGLWQQSERVDLDIDSTGLMVYGRTFEGIRKGYFPRQRRRRSYRLSLASTRHPAGSEILALFLDPANISPAARFWDRLYQAAEVLGSFDRVGLILADASCGSGPDIAALFDLNLSFIIKGYAPLSPQQADAPQIFDRYNQRQSIEAVIKSAKYGLSVKHLRIRSYHSIENFLQLVAITFNLLAWFRHYLLAPLDLQDLGLCEITQKLMDIPARCRHQDKQLIHSLSANHPFTRALTGM